MKRIVTQMAGCLNVLSRLKISSICIFRPMIVEPSCRQFSAIGHDVNVVVAVTSGAATRGGSAEQDSPGLRYHQDSTTSFPTLINIEHFK